MRAISTVELSLVTHQWCRISHVSLTSSCGCFGGSATATSVFDESATRSVRRCGRRSTPSRRVRSIQIGCWSERQRVSTATICDCLFEAGYIDDIFGAALGYDRAAAMRDLAVGLAKFLGFDVAQPKKIAGPTSQMAVLGASLTLQTRVLALDPGKAVSYEAQVSEALKRKSSMRLTDFLSLTCKLVHAAQYRPAGRPYLTCMFTAMRQATRSGAKRVRLGRGVRRDLRWWQR